MLMVIFKYFQQYRVNTFQAITVNYFVAATLGYVLSVEHIPFEVLIHRPWIGEAMLIGCVFIGMFYLMALSSQKVSVAVTSVANKMSLVIPVVAGMMLYAEPLRGLRLLGVILALISVVMVTYRKSRVDTDKRYLLLPVLIFFGSGFLDTFFKYAQTHLIAEDEFGIFSSSLFLMAATVGTVVMVIRRFTSGAVLEPKSIVAGVLLGIPNYFSIHFLLQALNIPQLPSTQVFPINNTGIVLLSTLLAILLFKESLTKLNWAGIACSVVAIALIAFA
jgi:drug/metabolite transporter (DMT)-like permease